MARIIKQSILVKLGRSIIGPVLPRLAVNGLSGSRGSQEKRVHVTCSSCGCEIGLEQEVFYAYGGPAKCFSCSATLGMKMESGTLETHAPIRPLLGPTTEHDSQASVIGQENKRAKQSRRLLVEG